MMLDLLENRIKSSEQLGIYRPVEIVGLHNQRKPIKFVPHQSIIILLHSAKRVYYVSGYE